MKKIFTITATLLIGNILFAQDKKQKDKKAIKAMTGCYEVSFRYAETFRMDTSYEYHDRYSTGASAEWIFVDEETEDEIVIQHILVARDTIVIKHWRQDWLYEHNRLMSFVKNKHWSPEKSSKKRWMANGPRKSIR
ncbi:MAG: DUF6607 family protein [Flavobacteriales bacterium]